MGILDNDFMRLIASGSPYMQALEANRRQDELGARYQNLLGQYDGSGMGPPTEAMQAGQAALGGGLLGGGARGQVPDSFYAAAAAIPGYQGLAAGAQANQAAMGRQRQAQDWGMANVPLAETQRMAQQSDQFGRTLGEQQRQFDNPSGYQARQLDANREQWAGLSEYQRQALKLQQSGQAQSAYAQNRAGDLAREEFDWRRLQGQGGDARNPLGLKPHEVVARDQAFYDSDITAGIAQQAVQEMRDWTNSGGRFAEPARAATVGKAWQLAVMGMMTEINKSGVVNGQELPRLISLMGDPSKWVNLTNADRMQVEVINEWMQQRRQGLYVSNRMMPPALDAGQNPLFRGMSRGAHQGRSPSGQGVPYQPGQGAGASGAWAEN